MLLNNFYNYEHSYNQVFDVFCFHNAVRQVLEYYGVKDGMFFINSTLNINISEDTSNILGFKLGLIDNSTVLPTFSDKIINYSQNDFKDFESLFEDNKRRVNSGTPIITVVDTFFLNYSINYNKSHNLHVNIFCGYSEDSDSISVVDWFAPWYFKGNIPYNEYYLARTSSNPSGESLFGGHPINGRFLEVKSGDWGVRIDCLLYETVCLTLEQNIEAAETLKSVSNRGLSGLKFILNLIKLNSALNFEDKSAFLKSLFNKLLLIKNGFSFSMLYFKLSYERLNLTEIRNVVESLENIILQFNTFLPIILKASFVDSDVLYQKVVNMLSNLLDSFEVFINRVYILKQSISRE